ncbi:MAG: hypothetical protein DI551_02365 [Micavibrio aeruginosavorus]|uniref:Uncharacterized protein n=1 Tax=Micavibrio aeruginosavorus TaxID=349221 RepID=A0A2W5N6T8_9BACT|nr:MAG: hypothetical protein DI551_02365 [Micavibrio aeruginosavorus]
MSENKSYKDVLLAVVGLSGIFALLSIPENPREKQICPQILKDDITNDMQARGAKVQKIQGWVEYKGKPCYLSLNAK